MQIINPHEHKSFYVEKTMEASLNFTSLNTRGGNNPLQFTLPVYCWKENTTPFYTITFPAATGTV